MLDSFTWDSSRDLIHKLVLVLTLIVIQDPN
nr:MAG TPA: hypothetical protein [Bacteriophage sp.]